MTNKMQFGTINDIMQTLDCMSIEKLKEVLAYIINVYVLEGGISYEGNIKDIDRKIDHPNSCYENDNKNISSFSDLVVHLKSKYSFPELAMFTIKKNEVEITIDGEIHNLSFQSSTTKQTPLIIENNKFRSKGIEETPDKGNDSGRFNKLEMD